MFKMFNACIFTDLSHYHIKEFVTQWYLLILRRLCDLKVKFSVLLALLHNYIVDVL